MQWQDRMDIGNIKKTAAGFIEPAAKFIQNGAHAQQVIPAQHRLGAAGGMFLGWFALDKMRDIIFGVNQLTEGEYEEVKREDVPLPLRFLHKTVDWNPHSDAPADQWKKVAYQLLPAIGAGVGTVGGSMYAIERTGRTQNFMDVVKKKPYTLLDADWLSQNVQAKPLRVLTAITGAFSAASMAPLIYGAFLNLSFATATGGRIFTGSFAPGNANPERAVKTLLGNLPEYVKDGKINDKWAQNIVDKGLMPFFKKDLTDPKKQEEVRTAINSMLKNSFEKYNNMNPAELAAIPGVKKILEAKKINDISKLTDKETKSLVMEAFVSDIKAAFGNSSKGFDQTLSKIGLDINKAEVGNAIPFAREFNDFLTKVGIREKAASSKSFADDVLLRRKESSSGVTAGMTGMAGVGA